MLSFALGDWGHVGAYELALMGEDRFCSGACGACQRYEPVGGAAKRMLDGISLDLKV